MLTVELVTLHLIVRFKCECSTSMERCEFYRQPTTDYIKADTGLPHPWCPSET